MTTQLNNKTKKRVSTTDGREFTIKGVVRSDGVELPGWHVSREIHKPGSEHKSIPVYETSDAPEKIEASLERTKKITIKVEKDFEDLWNETYVFSNGLRWQMIKIPDEGEPFVLVGNLYESSYFHSPKALKSKVKLIADLIALSDSQLINKYS